MTNKSENNVVEAYIPDEEHTLIIDGESGQIIKFEPPTEIVIPVTEDAAKLDKKYSKLKKIDPDSKKEYKALKAAIKVVADARKDITKEEDKIKSPLNKWRAALIKKAKELRLPFETLEKTLNTEKTRVDNIIASRLAEQKKGWEVSMETMRHTCNLSVSLPAADLPRHLIMLEAWNLDEDDYGDLLEDAEHLRAKAIQIAEGGIATEKERVRIAEESAKLEAEKIKQTLMIAEAEAYMEEARRYDEAMKSYREMGSMHGEAMAMNETHDLKAQMAAIDLKRVDDLRAEETVIKVMPDLSKFSDKDLSISIEFDRSSKIMTAMELQGAIETIDAKPVVTSSLSDFDDDDESPDYIDDLQALLEFKVALMTVAKQAPLGIIEPDYSTAVNRVVSSLTKGCDYLQRVMNGDPA